MKLHWFQTLWYKGDHGISAPWPLHQFKTGAEILSFAHAPAQAIDGYYHPETAVRYFNSSSVCLRGEVRSESVRSCPNSTQPDLVFDKIQRNFSIRMINENRAMVSVVRISTLLCALDLKWEAALPQHLHHLSHRIGASMAGPWTQHGWSDSPIRTVSALKVLKSQWRGIFRDIIHQTHITAHAITHSHTHIQCRKADETSYFLCVSLPSSVFWELWLLLKRVLSCCLHFHVHTCSDKSKELFPGWFSQAAGLLVRVQKSLT